MKEYRFSATWGDMVSDEYRLQRALLNELHQDQTYWVDYLLNDLPADVSDKDIYEALKYD